MNDKRKPLKPYFHFLADDFWMVIPTIGFGSKKMGFGWLAWHVEIDWSK